MMARIFLSCAVLVLLGNQVSTQNVTTAPFDQPTMPGPKPFPTPGSPDNTSTINPTGNPINTPRTNPTGNPINIPGTNPTGNPINTPGTNSTGNPINTPGTKPTGNPINTPAINSTGNPVTEPAKTPITRGPNPIVNPTGSNSTGNPITTARPNSTAMPTVYTQQPSEIKLEKDNLLETIPKLGIEWEVSFEFKPEKYDQSGFTNILHLTIGEDVSQIGDRIPAIFYHPDSGLHVATAIAKNPNAHRDVMPAPPLGKWTSIVVSQLMSGSKTIFSVNVDGADPLSVENPAPKEFSNVKVYASDPWWDAQPGSIRGLTIKTQ